MIYLDCSATSLQKPQAVHRAVQRAMETMASPGRGSHRPAVAAANTAFQCRQAAAELFHVPAAEQVVFTFNATHALNIAIHSLVGPGDRVVVSGYEHNAVMRPLHSIGAKVDMVRAPLFDHASMVQGFEKALPGAKAAVCTVMSNVFGYILPIYEIAALCRAHHVPLIVDASQGAGCMDLDFARLGSAYMAMPGHKGLLGPQGTGLLLCGETPRPLLAGGTGSDSRSREMPELLPDRVEAGTHNIPGIAGLLEGIRYVLRTGTKHIQSHEYQLRQVFVRQAKGIPGLTVYFTDDPALQGGVVSVCHASADCETLTEALGQRGVAVRGGLHCAPCAHETAGTGDTGTLRFSFSPFNTRREAIKAAELTKNCVNNLKT